jgi:hypothetical protein
MLVVSEHFIGSSRYLWYYSPGKLKLIDVKWEKSAYNISYPINDIYYFRDNNDLFSSTQLSLSTDAMKIKYIWLYVCTAATSRGRKGMRLCYSKFIMKLCTICARGYSLSCAGIKRNSERQIIAIIYDAGCTRLVRFGVGVGILSNARQGEF